jgi:hypothetical protein
MALFGPSREERLSAAERTIAPYGFRFDASRAADLKQYLPLREAAAPASYVTGCFGRIEDAVVEGYEYEYTSSDTDGNTSWHSATLIAVQHRAIAGTASFAPEWKEWSTVAAAFDAITWVPPFILVKIVQWLAESSNPDRTVGDADFDRLYKVHGASDEAARAGLPPALRSAALRIGFRGTLETRPGLLLYAPYGESFDAKTIVSAFGIATVFIGALREESMRAHPMR